MGHFKIFMASIIMMLFALPIMAQDVGAAESVTIDVASFGGIVALTSLIVTQFSKVIPVVSNNKWLKILISAVVGILVCMVLWLLKVNTPMVDMEWWQALLYGLAAGLSGSGLYDLIKAVVNIFSKKEE